MNVQIDTILARIYPCSTRCAKKKKKKKCKAVLKEIEAGHVSDPAGMSLYRQIKTDKDGLPIHRCLQGTSSVEGGVHQNIIRKFVFFNSSPELANYALAEYSLRHNTEVSNNIVEI
ncbi:hypothetical protein INT48_002736 [Thamnidium elegans]|uniref:Uncharacterized protein n=1 Tax=Thamnidium elegans TaxID=101142 RepID=A0A8H7VQ95_9FUNG|nr:hypothetical protein INT48_002736 [Thamnidium elegans]